MHPADAENRKCIYSSKQSNLAVHSILQLHGYSWKRLLHLLFSLLQVMAGSRLVSGQRERTQGLLLTVWEGQLFLCHPQDTSKAGLLLATPTLLTEQTAAWPSAVAQTQSLSGGTGTCWAETSSRVGRQALWGNAWECKVESERRGND